MAGGVGLGIDLKKEEVRWTLIGGTQGAPAYKGHGRKRYQLGDDRSHLAKNFRNIFVELFAEHKPEVIGYRVNHSITKVDQAAYLIMPFGILADLCFDEGIKLVEYNNMSFTAKRFGLGKGQKPADVISEVCGSPAPHWDQNQQYAAMSAWGALNV